MHGYMFLPLHHWLMLLVHQAQILNGDAGLLQGSRSSVVRASTAKVGGLGFDSQWLPKFFPSVCDLPPVAYQQFLLPVVVIRIVTKSNHVSLHRCSGRSLTGRNTLRSFITLCVAAGRPRPPRRKHFHHQCQFLKRVSLSSYTYMCTGVIHEVVTCYESLCVALIFLPLPLPLPLSLSPSLPLSLPPSLPPFLRTSLPPSLHPPLSLQHLPLQLQRSLFPCNLLLPLDVAPPSELSSSGRVTVIPADDQGLPHPPDDSA